MGYRYKLIKDTAAAQIPTHRNPESKTERLCRAKLINNITNPNGAIAVFNVNPGNHTNSIGKIAKLVNIIAKAIPKNLNILFINYTVNKLYNYPIIESYNPPLFFHANHSNMRERNEI